MKYRNLQIAILCVVLTAALILSGCQAAEGGSSARAVSEEAEESASASGTTAVSTPSAAAPPEKEASVTPTPAPKPTEAAKPKPTKKTTPSPAPEKSLHDLRTIINKKIKGYDGTWSVYCKRLDTGEHFCINDEPRISASLIKLYVFGAAMEAIEKGDLLFEDWSEPLELMIEYSDNESCNILINAVGGFEAVNDFIEKHGFKNTELYRYMQEQNDIENFTSTKECGHLLELVLEGKYVSEETSELLLYHLKNQYTLYKIPAGIPKGVRTASKSGELDDAQHDAAIIFSPACTYILVIMSNDLAPYFEGADEAIAEIGELSKTVYNYLND